MQTETKILIASVLLFLLSVASIVFEGTTIKIGGFLNQEVFGQASCFCGVCGSSGTTTTTTVPGTTTTTIPAGLGCNYTGGAYAGRTGVCVDKTPLSNCDTYCGVPRDWCQECSNPSVNCYGGSCDNATDCCCLCPLSTTTTTVPGTTTTTVPGTTTTTIPGTTTTTVPSGSVWPVTFTNPLSATTFKELIVSIVNWLLAIVGSIVLLFIIIGGIMYMTAAGNEEQIKRAKRILLYTILGFAIVLISYSLIQEIKKILGI